MIMHNRLSHQNSYGNTPHLLSNENHQNYTDKISYKDHTNSNLGKRYARQNFAYTEETPARQIKESGRSPSPSPFKMRTTASRRPFKYTDWSFYYLSSNICNGGRYLFRKILACLFIKIWIYLIINLKRCRGRDTMSSVGHSTQWISRNSWLTSSLVEELEGRDLTKLDNLSSVESSLRMNQKWDSRRDT